MARILIVDDEKSIRRTLSEFLRRDGHEVQEVEEAELALQQLKAIEFDVVVTDIILPRITGVELLQRIRAAAPQVQVVMMTGEPTVETASESLRAGAADYLFKPVTKAAILRVVTNAMKIKALDDAKRRLEVENRLHEENLERMVDERTRQLRASEERAQELSRFNQAVLDALTAHICVLAGDGTILAVNRAWRDFAAMNPIPSVNTGVGANYLAQCEAAIGEDAVTAQEAARGLRAVMGGQAPDFTLEYPCHSPDARRWFMLQAARFEGGGAVGAVVAHFNITEQKLLEEQLRHAAKMEAIGQLAGGVAHDFNNILAAVLLHLGLLRQTSQLTPDTQESLKELEKETLRATSLTRQLLVFSRRELAHPRPLDLNELIHSLLKMLRRLLGEQLEVVFLGASDSIWLKADAGMMEQVVMNLCINARDAMPEGGLLTLGTKLVDVADNSPMPTADARAGRFVCLSVTDTGCGMDETVLKRIFEPFFTTKEAGKGTGLGLATVYGIAKQHNGWIEVDSQVGKGSSFRVYLPALTTPVECQKITSPSDEIKGGSETILLVEDDLSLRRSAVLCLRKLGYAVLEASNGAHALGLWRQHQQDIKLLLADQVLPHAMTGLELALRLKKEKPDLKVIISSGYSADLGRPQPKADQEFTYIAKPYQAITLANVVRQSLAKTD